MIVFRYDNTFQGLLNVVFESFTLKIKPDEVVADGEIVPLFATEIHHIITDITKFERVKTAMKKKLPNIMLTRLTQVWMSEVPERSNLIFNFLYKAFNTKQNITTNYADIDVLTIKQLAKKVSHETHHLMEFVRFNAVENSGEKVYFAVVEPRYNSLPLAIPFFKNRFAFQKWAIFDAKRQYGFYWDLKTVESITLDSDDELILDGKINKEFLSQEEQQFQTMWHRYCKAITIKERINPKLQRQHMPKRFWKHMPEMWDE
ncbi:TIGR03915 family putative DNA repair protein [Orbaceae bacterium ac157xtp]